MMMLLSFMTEAHGLSFLPVAQRLSFLSLLAVAVVEKRTQTALGAVVPGVIATMLSENFPAGA
jgi:hypothetical protein